MDISIIVATYNYAKTLRQVLETLLQVEIPQGIQHEILIVDNNSTDDTASVVKRISEKHPNVRYLLEKERGTSNARNLAISEAQGKLLLFTDHDVFVDKGWVRAYWDLFQNKRVKVAQGKILLDKELTDMPPWADLKTLPYFDPQGEREYVEELIACNIAARKEIFELYGCFSPFLGPGKTGAGEDTELGSRFMAVGLNLHYCPEAVVYHESIPERTTSQYYLDRVNMTGRCGATRQILLEWERPRQARIIAKLAKYSLKCVLARLAGRESRLFKNKRKTVHYRGALIGTRDALEEKRRICEKKPTLSGCVITQNSAHCLGKALKSIEGLCDEIVVVDGGSEDNTAEIAKSFDKVRYFVRPWPGNYSEQKNWAFNKARGDWILSLDSDEVVGASMRSKISDLMRSKKHCCYKFPRFWLISDSPCRYVHNPHLYPDYQQRLFRNIPMFRYTSDRVNHHRFPPLVRGRAKKVKDTHIFHYDYMYNDRVRREAKVADRIKAQPETADVDRKCYLYEDFPHRMKSCTEEL